MTCDEQTWVKSRLEGGQSVVFEHVQKGLCKALVLAGSRGIDVGHGSMGARHFRGYQVCHQGMHRHLILFDSLFSKQACPVVPTFCVLSYCILLFYTLLIRVGFNYIDQFSPRLPTRHWCLNRGWRPCWQHYRHSATVMCTRIVLDSNPLILPPAVCHRSRGSLQVFLVTTGVSLAHIIARCRGSHRCPCRRFGGIPVFDIVVVVWELLSLLLHMSLLRTCSLSWVCQAGWQPRHGVQRSK